MIVGLTDGELVVEVSDDGVGFDPEAQTTGFGLAGMRERVYLADGTLEVISGERGSLVRVRLPARRKLSDAPSVADQAAS